MFNPENQLEQPKKPTDWEVLGVSEDATLDEIKAAYRKAVMQVHPDIKKDGDEEAFKKINEAYERLSGKSKKSKKSEETATAPTNPESAEVARKYKEVQEAWEKEKDPFKEHDPDKTDLYG